MKIKNLPKRIYLQIGEDCECNDWNDIYPTQEVSWCADKINNNDIVYNLKAGRVQPEVSDDFGEPEINQVEYDKWLSDQKFYSDSEGTPISQYILQNYFDMVEQFIKSPKSKATKVVFEVATQIIKKYLSQNSH